MMLMTRIAPSAVSPNENGMVRTAYSERTKTRRSNQYHARNATPITVIRRGVQHAAKQLVRPRQLSALLQGDGERNRLVECQLARWRFWLLHHAIRARRRAYQPKVA